MADLVRLAMQSALPFAIGTEVTEFVLQVLAVRRLAVLLLGLALVADFASATSGNIILRAVVIWKEAASQVTGVTLPLS